MIINIRSIQWLSVCAVFIVFFLSLNTIAQAQRKPGNEWINYGQPYYKVKVSADGVYRITYADMDAAGLPLSAIDPARVQVFFRGEEIPLRMNLQNGSAFSVGDYIEFWAQRNDGALDSVLYLKPTDQPHKNISMYTDTAAYFLTWGNTTGKRVVNRAPATVFPYASQQNYIHESAQYYAESYTNGTPIISQFNFYGSDYDLGEGWLSNNILYRNGPGIRNFSINTPSYNSAAGNPELEILIYGKSDVSSKNPDHHLYVKVGKDASSLRTILDTTYDGFRKVLRKFTLNSSDLGSGTTIVQVTSAEPDADVQSVAYIKIRYPRSFELNGSFTNQRFTHTNASVDSLSHIEFYGSSFASQPPLGIYDIRKGIYAPVSYVSGNPHFNMPNTGTPSEYYVFNTTNVASLPLTKVDFAPIDASQNYNYLIITHVSLADAAAEMSNYKKGQIVKDSVEIKPVIAFTDQLYDEFFYGIHHPAALQNFLAYMWKNSSIKPEYLLLLGKGFEPDLVRSRLARDLVPVVGLPPSDLMYIVGIDNGFQRRDTMLKPLMAVGRIAAKTPEEVKIYLEKLKAHDNSQGAAWKKKIIHVTGGDNVNQQKANHNFMVKMSKTIREPLVGGNPIIFSVNNSDVIFKDFRQAIQNNLNDGAGMLTYMAHGSLNILAVDIGDFDKLSNKGRYPIIYINGCNVGNIGLDYDPQTRVYSLGERYMLTPDKGSIAWLSHSNLTLDNVLPVQIDRTYKHMSGDAYGSTIGEVWKKTLEDMQAYNNSLEYRALSYELILQGDPAMQLPFIKKTDYKIGEANPFITPNDVLAGTDSFQVAIPVVNLGKTDTQQLAVKVVQQLPNNTKITYPLQYFNPVYYADTLFFRIARGIHKIQGVNRFEITLDPDSLIQEMTKGNNSISFEHYFPGTGVRNIFPANYSIVPNDKPEIVVQSRDLFDTTTGAFFEMDTTSYFNSPMILRSGLISGSNLMKWTPQLNIKDGSELKDSTVYYWRSRLNLPADSGGEWETRSFTYIKGSPQGWSQSHFQQYNTIGTEQIEIDTLAREFKFLTAYRGYTLNCNYYYHSNLGIKADDGPQSAGAVKGTSKVVFMEVDQYSLEYFENKADSERYSPTWNGSKYISYYWGYLQFDMDVQAERDRFADRVHEVKEGNYVLLITRRNVDYTKFDAKTMEIFTKVLGAQLIDKINQKGTAYVLAAQKFDAGGRAIAEDTAYDPNGENLMADRSDVAEVHVSLEGKSIGPGTITSSLIGPASNWKHLHQDFRSVEINSADIAYLMVYGRDKAGIDTLLLDSVGVSSLNISDIDAEKYPYLYYTAVVKDSVTRTPKQLKLWQALYDGLPEGTLLYDQQFVFSKDTVDQGDSLNIQTRYTNISQYPMKKVLVTFSVHDAKNNLASADSIYYPALQAGESIKIDHKMSTSGLRDNNRLTLYVNPGYDQPEVMLDNNIMKFPFYVRSDKFNPLLDVTFDAKHIANMAIVSASPVIKVNVTDEVYALQLDDTSAIELSLLRPGATSPERLYFSDPDLSFSGTYKGSNKATATYTPKNLQAGIYMFSAQAVDKAGNVAGRRPYNVYFRVVENMAASYLFVYPNPVTTSARFVFTLTGNSLPDRVTIDIFDVSGRLVSNIGKDRMNGLTVGENQVDWKATDNNGNPLRSGLYLYRLTVKHNDNDVDHYTTPQDLKMEGTLGKLMIIRD